MAKQKTPARSFNTVKHSNRDKRIKRKQNQRIVLLSIFLVVILIVLSMLSFGVLSIVNLIRGNQSGKPPVGNPNEQDPLPPAEIVYTALPKLNSEINQGELIIININHYYSPENALPSLKLIRENQAKNEYGFNIYELSEQHYQLNVTALDAFNEMMQKYYSVSDGDTTTKVSDAYRTAEAQSQKPNTSVQAGYSDHHSGYCLALRINDGNFLDPNHWIYENAHKYGFVVRYPAGKESFTYVNNYTYCLRYVGVAHATYMKANNLCMEEYVALLQQNYASSTDLTFTGVDGNQYKVYYTPASTDTLTTLQVPSNYEYSISGDNMGGFIVTVNLSKPITESAE